MPLTHWHTPLQNYYKTSLTMREHNEFDCKHFSRTHIRHLPIKGERERWYPRNVCDMPIEIRSTKSRLSTVSDLCSKQCSNVSLECSVGVTLLFMIFAHLRVILHYSTTIISAYVKYCSVRRFDVNKMNIYFVKCDINSFVVIK